jgi:hypothetical protein
LSPPIVCCHRIPGACEKTADALNRRTNIKRKFFITEVQVLIS